MTTVYNLQPINFEMLDAKQKRDAVSNFVGFISSLPSSVQMIITKEPVGWPLSADEVLTAFPARFYLVSETPIDGILRAFDYRFIMSNELPSYQVEFARKKYVLLKDRSFVKGYTVTELSSFSNVGFITNLLDYVDRIYVPITPLPRREMKSRINRYRDLLKEKWNVSNRKNEDLERDIARAEAALTGIADGTEKLFRTRMTFVVRGASYEELKSRAETFLELIHSSSVNEMDSPQGELIQTQLALGRGRFSGADLYVTTRSIPALFPFISAEMVDDSGVLFGVNYNTGGPIIYDPFMRSNYNAAIVAKTGSGKSMLVKTFVSRFLAKYTDAALFIIESIVKPEYTMGADGSYAKSFGGLTGCDLVKLDYQNGINFDPMLIFKKDDYQDALAVTSSLGDITEKDELRALEPLIKDNIGVPMKTLIDSVPEGNLKADLKNMYAKFSFLFFEGKPVEMSSKMIFDAHNLPDEVKEKAVSMIFLLVQKIVSQLPTKKKKIVVIDEAWAYLGCDKSTGKLNFPAAAKFMDRMTRQGRHDNVFFITATQEIGDLMRMGEPGTIIQQAATKIFLLNENVSKVLQESFGLSPDETDFLEKRLKDKPGYGILLAEGQHYAFYNKVSKDEMTRFTTKPSEVSY